MGIATFIVSISMGNTIKIQKVEQEKEIITCCMGVIKGNSNCYHMINKGAYCLHIFSLISSPFVMNISLTFYIIETPLNRFGNRADPDQAALLRAA